jgi:adenosylmethionine-8-amino-7-oxononanoate aminotransferase
MAPHALPEQVQVEANETCYKGAPQKSMNGTNVTHVNSSVLHQQIKQDPTKIVSGKGNYLLTSTGAEIFDATGGAAVACIGHGNARVKESIAQQLDKIAYCYLPFFTNEPAEKLARELVESTSGKMEKVFIVSSGETNPVACSLSYAKVS